jgi:hypothetical protein
MSKLLTMKLRRLTAELRAKRSLQNEDWMKELAESRTRVQELRTAYEQHLARYPVVLGGEYGFPLPGSRSGPSDIG